MSTVSEATSRPWSVDRDHGVVVVVDDEERILCHCLKTDLVPAEECEANAELIVRAVNCHTDLLAACKALVDAWHADDDNFEREMADGTPDALRLSRAAIAKAIPLTPTP